MRMFIFLTVFLTLYGLMHFYAFWKAGRAFGFHKGVFIPLGLFMVFMIVCPILVRVCERNGMESLARMLACTGYTWMGFLFLFVAAAAMLDLYRLVVWMGEHAFSDAFKKWALSPKILFFIALGFSLLGGIYARVEASSIQTEYVVIKSPEISKDLGRIRVVQISDVHLGLIMGREQLNRILEGRDGRPGRISWCPREICWTGR